MRRQKNPVLLHRNSNFLRKKKNNFFFFSAVVFHRFENHHDTENRSIAHSQRGRERSTAQLHVSHSEQTDGIHAGEQHVWENLFR